MKVKDYDKELAECTTLVEVVQMWAKRQPNKRVATFLEDGETETQTLTYAELDLAARMVAGYLQAETELFDRVLLLFPPGMDFITAFIGCLYARRIPVPAYPPTANRNFGRLQKVIADCKASTILTNSKGLALFNRRPTSTEVNQNPKTDTSNSDSSDFLAGFKITATDQLAAHNAERYLNEKPSPQEIAFLQYTSGSTGTPKGVMVTQKNIIANLTMIFEAFEFNADYVQVSWLPVYHDMGLVGAILEPIFAGVSLVFMPPAVFLQKPAKWLRAISKYKGTCSGGPNFAFELCTKKIREDEISDIDLGCWKVAFNGAEPVRASTLNEFATRFSKNGFKQTSLYPCYGMAEVTLFISGGPVAAKPNVINASAVQLRSNKIAKPEQDSDSIPIVSSGSIKTQPGVSIVNPDTLLACEPGIVGEVWITGDNVAAGYWNDSEKTIKTFQNSFQDLDPFKHTADSGFLRTGDLGFIENGELYITGRQKDLVIISGRNHYPQDIEFTVENAHAAIRKGCIAAFSITGPTSEQLVIVAEIDRSIDSNNYENIALAATEAVAKTHELVLSRIVFIQQATLPKTSSGKLQRRTTRLSLENSTLRALYQWPVNGLAMSAPKIVEKPQLVKPNKKTFSTSKPALGEERRRSDTSRSNAPQQQKTLDSNDTQVNATFESILQNLLQWVAVNTESAIEGINSHAKLPIIGVDSVLQHQLAAHAESNFRVVLSEGILANQPTLVQIAETIHQLQQNKIM